MRFLEICRECLAGDAGKSRDRTPYAICIAAVALVVEFTPCIAGADVVGYGDTRTITAESKTLKVEHFHDWSEATREARWKMISTNNDPFTADNNYSYISVKNKLSGAELFRAPTPALSYLWISPDSRYIVGTSKIMLWNPIQLVVFSNTGRRLLARDMRKVEWPGVRATASKLPYFQ